MKITEDVTEYAYLMNKTGYSYRQIFRYIKTQEFYFTTLDDEEPVNEKDMFEFIKRKTGLTNKQVINIGKAQLSLLEEDISTDKICFMVKEMVKSFSKEDMDCMDADFYLYALDYSEFF